ncbi:DsbA family protein [Methyloprofundus sp.]|uniref:DsbA family protein n=1 Tax=Methyloprofundus sp. TaxID=2020875 RepID=UPI003D0FD226
MHTENNTLYYIYDPMCSWCYAYEQSLQALQKQLPDELHFVAILGGLAADTQTPMPIETQAMIQSAWRQIEETVANVHFNFDFWTKNTPYRSTYSACRAILAATNQAPEYAKPMRQAIQQAYYQNARNPSLNEVLIDCARQLGLNSNQFSKDLQSMAINLKLTEHRHFSQQLVANSFPSLRLALDSETYTIPIDYNVISPTLDIIHQRLNSHQNDVVESPCIRDCRLNDQDVCLGCFRQLNEITNWAYCDNAEKQAVLDQAAQRKNIYNKNLI